jgi:hypothetical protein
VAITPEGLNRRLAQVHEAVGLSPIQGKQFRTLWTIGKNKRTIKNMNRNAVNN